MLTAAAAPIRASIEAAARSLLTIPDGRLLDAWEWRGARQSIRFGVYHLHEVIEETLAGLAPAAAWTPGAALLSRVTAARWALHGAVLPYPDLLDAPAGSEWTLRQVLSHVVTAQEFWNWLSAHWVEKLAAAGELPPAGYVREEVPDRFRSVRVLDGDLDALRAELDGHVDGAARNVLELERRGRLDVTVAFQRAAVPIRYYPARWSAHLREHANQASKTVPLTGREVRETERLVQVVIRAYGELEAVAQTVPENVAAPVLEAAGRRIAGRAEELSAAAAG